MLTNELLEIAVYFVKYLLGCPSTGSAVAAVVAVVFTDKKYWCSCCYFVDCHCWCCCYCCCNHSTGRMDLIEKIADLERSGKKIGVPKLFTGIWQYWCLKTVQ
jgi:hypothetical protein